MVDHPERILQFVCVSVVPDKVRLVCHKAISGSSGTSQIKICQQVLQLKTHSFALFGNSFLNAPLW